MLVLQAGAGANSVLLTVVTQAGKMHSQTRWEKDVLRVKAAELQVLIHEGCDHLRNMSSCILVVG